MKVFNREVFSPALYFFGCMMLVPSCILLIYPKEFMEAAVIGLILACLSITISAVIDLYEAQHLLNSNKYVVSVSKAQRARNTTGYQMLGAVFFLTASIMYLPFLASKSIMGTTAANLGTWVFRFGSCAYLGSSFRSMSDLLKRVHTKGRWYKQDVIILIGICAFMLGSFLYIMGGAVGQIEIGSKFLMPELWVMGSISFVVGSFIFLKYAISNLS